MSIATEQQSSIVNQTSETIWYHIMQFNIMLCQWCIIPFASVSKGSDKVKPAKLDIAPSQEYMVALQLRTKGFQFRRS